MAFTHLHVHSEYSLLDGACRIKDLPKAAKKMGQTALAITDHGAMYGVVDFYRACKKEGIKPIIGCEVYVAPRTRFDKTFDLDKDYYHMVLLCENNTGYQNLIKIVSLGFTEGFYNKPRIDDNLLEKYNKGLICLSACLSGEIPKKLLRNDYNKAKEKALYYQNIFGKDNFFIELQNHGIEEQQRINPNLIKIANEINAPLVATNDSHYINKSDSQTHNILLCIQTNKTINDENPMEFKTDEFYLKSEEEMRSLFPDIPQAFDNTQLIADRCNVEFEFGVRKLPHFDLPDGVDHYEYFKNQCYKGLKKHYKNPDNSLIDRLEYELSTINKMGFVDYYLIVNDFVQYAKSQDIPVGPGRGSGAGSLCAYCIGITDVDPIKYNLLFERFLNPERVSMPDFDIDFCKDRRSEVIDYVIRKYGADHVAQIIAFGTMAARGSIRDVGRALAVPYNVVDQVAKLVPMEIGMTIKKALSIQSSELKKRYDSDREIKNLLDVAMSIEGMPRHATTHAAGVVITEQPVSDYVPLASNDGNIVTEFTMTALEELGLLKMDFLGLRNLTVINDTVKMIHQKEPDFLLDNIDESDNAVFKMMSSGNSEGVFQFESQGMKNVLTQLRPESLEDLIAVISLYRPGPMDSIPTYIDCRHNPSHIRYKHPLLKDILEVTYGCIVYQEQVMQILRTLAGYSLGRADIVRRAMSKKKHDVMEKERNVFINGLTDDNGIVIVEGCLRRGVDEKTAISIYDEMESFASYAFNKSHATAYAKVSYQTAWLKCHYPMEYMAALMSSVLDNQNKLSAYIAECHSLGIQILPPSVNHSYYQFTVSGNNIRYGLLAIKNLGKSFIDSIIKEREKGEFTSFYNFCKRLYGQGMNSKAVESLIKCGALDNLGANRRQMFAVMKSVLNDLEFDNKKNVQGQMSFFDFGNSSNALSSEPEIPDLEEYSKSELLFMENEVAGMYLSGHPISEYDDYINAVKADKIGEIIRPEQSIYKDRQQVCLVCIVSKIKNQTTKNNQMMAFVQVEDRYGSIEVIVFPDAYSKYGALLGRSNAVEIHGTISLKEDEEPKIICNQIYKIPDDRKPRKNVVNYEPENNSKKNIRNKPLKLFIRIDNLNTELYKKAVRILNIFEGGTPVVFYLTDTQKRLIAPNTMWVSLNDVMIDELKYQLGNDNVVIC